MAAEQTTTTREGEPAFASNFPAVDAAHWRQLVDKVLKGGSFDKLVGRTYDGLPIEPLHPRAAAANPIVPAHTGAWDRLARIDDPDPSAGHTQALTDLENGADSLHLVFAGSDAAHGFGLPPTAEALEIALESVILETGVTIQIDAGAEAAAIARHLTALVAARKLAPSDVRIFFGLDPVGDAARAGSAILGTDFADHVKALLAAGFATPSCVADGRLIHAAGGSEAQELAFAIASALTMLRVLEGAGIPLDAARDAMSFRVAADADEFLTIAKLRALRRLWSQVEIACGLAPKPVTIHAETAWRMMTRRDPWVNLLRGTVGAFSAGLGGADQISVLPFTQALGLPDGFARRLARNTQLVLIEEANLGRVVDAAAGAGGFERLTDDLARTAWVLLQTFEVSGGLLASFATFSADVSRVRAARLKNVARRKDPLTGTSEFPNVHEAPVDVTAPLPSVAPHGLFPAMRVSQDFERLRDRSDSILASTGQRPSIYLATLGTIADFTARAMFAKSFFEAGGFEATMHESGDLVAGFAASGARLACLCSSDAVYATNAVAAAEELRKVGATLSLAGRPGGLEEPLRAAGIGTFLFAGCDLIDTLTQALDLS